MSLYQLVYLSQSTRKLDKEELFALWKQAKANNGTIDVTGSLFYNGGWFMQVLEGPAPTLASLYDKIAKDPRHRDLRLLYNEPAAYRTFVRWTMNMTNLEDRQADRYEELVEVIEAAKAGRKIHALSAAVTLLNIFKS
ncbi:blue light sensor protein [Massilia dura]|uniref:Blue light sensor protein n=1 Tax=Pseudoduganella dura TaxID=321982 RepID=A0A6I3XGU1_9BURK|nr:BLUF domain-containing protein [Pseudoduganella dura]MUI15619.1 blue light sensor protein [Pseudoduganella dura]GGY17861.1 hypothetical protein GCM10007386_54400 [Pseudoduganella dura]